MRQIVRELHVMPVFGLFLILASWGLFSNAASAACTYSGALSWSGNCGATVNETLTDGATKTLSIPTLTLRASLATGVLAALSSKPVPGVKVPPAGSCKIGAGGGFGGANWTVLDSYSQPVSCGNMSIGQTASYRILNGTSLTVTNILPGVTGSITYSCTNGQLVAQGSGICEIGGSGGGPTPDPGGGGGGGTPGPTPDPGGGGGRRYTYTASLYPQRYLLLGQYVL